MSIRLIDTSTLQMRVFEGSNVPAYAILSHTWAPGEEVTYEEMNEITKSPNHPARKKSGYNKIAMTCQLAHSHKIRYAWVDTCAIDKKSSAELGEAINSMFKWYQNAEECYVYLSDLPTSWNVAETLGKCRWFTRGWTLQELIAPVRVLFFDEAWNCIGSKLELLGQISEITKIDDSVLSSSKSLDTLQSIPVARRMSWASKRITTRIEDAAYSLLGIFDVNMPLLYGEGDKAFLRLQEEIIRRSNDLSIFCSSLCIENPSGRSRDSYNLSRLESYRPQTGPVHKAAEESKLPYRNLFARSPIGFTKCGSVVATELSTAQFQIFSLTNNVLHFPKAELDVVVVQAEESACYLLPLNCQTAENGRPCYMVLHKVGPGFFARLPYCWLWDGQPHRVSNPRGKPKLKSQLHGMTEEAHILGTVPPSIRREPDYAGRHALNIRPRNLRFAVQEAIPRESWDAANLRFVGEGRMSFQAVLVLHVYSIASELISREARTKTLKDTLGRTRLYLACGVEAGNQRPWTHLMSPTDWEYFQNLNTTTNVGSEMTWGLYAQGVWGNSQSTSMSFESLRVTATIDEWRNSEFKIKIEATVETNS